HYSHVNAVKVCPNNIFTEGCSTISYMPIFGNAVDMPGYVLPNGALVMTSADNCCTLPAFPDSFSQGQNIDWNGPNKGPNQIGDDIIMMGVCYGDADCSPYMNFGYSTQGIPDTVNAASGIIFPYVSAPAPNPIPNEAANRKLWNDIFN